MLTFATQLNQTSDGLDQNPYGLTTNCVAITKEKENLEMAQSGIFNVLDHGLKTGHSADTNKRMLQALVSQLTKRRLRLYERQRRYDQLSLGRDVQVQRADPYQGLGAASLSPSILFTGTGAGTLHSADLKNGSITP